MTVKYDFCIKCGGFELTGTMPCEGGQVCYKCVAKEFKVPEKEVRENLEKKFARAS